MVRVFLLWFEQHIQSDLRDLEASARHYHNVLAKL